MEGSNNEAVIMVELDPSPALPIAPMETARISRIYLQKLGYTFRK